MKVLAECVAVIDLDESCVEEEVALKCIIRLDSNKLRVP